MKRYRDMTYHGGDSSKEAQAAVVKQTRFRIVREAADGEEAVYDASRTRSRRSAANPPGSRALRWKLRETLYGDAVPTRCG